MMRLWVLNVLNLVSKTSWEKEIKQDRPISGKMLLSDSQIPKEKKLGAWRMRTRRGYLRSSIRKSATSKRNASMFQTESEPMTRSTFSFDAFFCIPPSVLVHS